MQRHETLAYTLFKNVTHKLLKFYLANFLVHTENID